MMEILKVRLDTQASEHFIRSTPAAEGRPITIVTALDGVAGEGVIGESRLLVAPQGYTHDGDGPSSNQEPLICLTIKRAVLSAQLDMNILAIMALMRDGWQWNMYGDEFTLTDNQGNQYNAMIDEDGLPYIEIFDASTARELYNTVPCVDVQINDVPAGPRTRDQLGIVNLLTGTLGFREGLDLAHLRNCHYAHERIKESEARGALLGGLSKKASTRKQSERAKHCCHGCDAQRRTPSKKRSDARAAAPGDLTHLDFKVGMVTGYANQTCCLVMMDDCSRVARAYPLRGKDKAGTALRQYHAWMESYGHKLRATRSDNEPALTAGDFGTAMNELGLRAEDPAPYSSASAGRAEALIDDLWDHMKRCMIGGNVPKQYWPCVIQTVAMVRNNLIHAAIDAIPMFVLADKTGARKQDLSNMRIIGSVIYARNKKETNAHTPRCRRYIFLGLKNPHTMWLMDELLGTVVTHGHMVKSIEQVDSTDTIYRGDDLSPPKSLEDILNDTGDASAKDDTPEAGASTTETPRRVTARSRVVRVGIRRIDALVPVFDGPLIQGAVRLTDNENERHFVWAVSLIERIPEAYQLIAAKTTPGARIFSMAKDEQYQDWVGTIIALDTEQETAYLAWETREFSLAHMSKVTYVQPPTTPGSVEGGERAPEGATVTRSVMLYTQVRDPTAERPVKPEDALPDPIMLMENKHNIYIPTEKELPRMPDGPLKSAHIAARGDEGQNLHMAEVYEWARRRDMPKGATLIKTMTIYGIKWNDLNGLLEKFKARIVAKGYSQRKGVDFNDTYATTPKLSTMRYFIMIAAREGLPMYEFDIKAAYLNADLEEEIYATPPLGMERQDENGEQMVWRLKKALYGLKQSGNRWMVRFTAVLRKLGMTQSRADTSLWYRIDRTMILFVHTDDGKVAYSDRAALDALLKGIREEVTMGAETDKVERMFNIAIETSTDGTHMKLNQRAYVENMMRDHKIDPREWRAMLPPDLDMDKECGTELLPREGISEYLSLLQTLHWVARCTRWDIQTGVTLLSQASSAPRQSHMKLLRRLAQYTHATRGRSLLYKKTPGARMRTLDVFVDASAGHASKNRNLCGVTVFIDGNLIDWGCKTQPYLKLSSAEGEVCGVAIGATHVRYWQQLIEEVEGVGVLSNLYTDAEAAKQFSAQPIHKSSMRHIYLKYTFVRQWIENGYMHLSHYPGVKNTADVLTKVLGEKRQRELYRAGVPESEKEDGAKLEISEDESEDQGGTAHQGRPSKMPRRG